GRGGGETRGRHRVDREVCRVMAGLLEGRRAVVTGAAQGIGLEIARMLQEQGAAVLLADLDGDRAAAAAAEIGGTARGTACDVTDEADMEALVAKAVNELGG